MQHLYPGELTPYRRQQPGQLLLRFPFLHVCASATLVAPCNQGNRDLRSVLPCSSDNGSILPVTLCRKVTMALLRLQVLVRR